MVVMYNESKLFLTIIKDRSELVWLLLITIISLAVLLLVCIPFVWYIWFTLARRALRPIKMLSRKLKVLKANNGELNSDNITVTSMEAKKLFETFQDLITVSSFV
jgi:Flp pilus assembly protein TadB